jgi:hypothetical protein
MFFGLSLAQRCPAIFSGGEQRSAHVAPMLVHFNAKSAKGRKRRKVCILRVPLRPLPLFATLR